MPEVMLTSLVTVTLSLCCSSALLSARRPASTAVQQSHEADELYRKVEIEVKGHDKSVLDSYEKFAVMAAGGLNITVEQVYSPKKVIKRMSLLKSAFAKKKHFVQYESRTIYRTIEIQKVTGSTKDTYLEYIQRNLPEGVAMKVTTHRLEQLPNEVLQAIEEAELEAGTAENEDAAEHEEMEYTVEDSTDVVEETIVNEDTAGDGSSRQPVEDSENNKPH